MSEKQGTETRLEKINPDKSNLDFDSSEGRLFSQELLEKFAVEEKSDEIAKLLELEQKYFHRKNLNDIELQSKLIQNQSELEKLENLRLDNNKKEIENKSLEEKLVNESKFQQREFYFRWILIVGLFVLVIFNIWLAVTYVTIGLAFILLIVSVLALTGIIFVILKDSEDKKIFGKIIEKTIETSSKIK